MGTCTVCNNSLPENITYFEAIQLNIKERDRLGKVIRSDKVTFKLQPPSEANLTSFCTQNLELKVSSCLLSGLDPRSVISKECQDALVVLHKDQVLLAGVFDGHGTDGLKIVELVKNHIKKYFYANTAAFVSAGPETLKYLIIECDKLVGGQKTEIDATVSGCTAVLLLITDVIHIASVGDSKAVLAMIGPNPDYTPGNRHVDPGKTLFPLKLAVEQRPNIREELERIKKSGGKVQQLTSSQGVKIGPYRVWKKTGNLPGLAMSRSIGDLVGKEIGVISTPISNSFLFDKNNDLFIVLSSDGLWDVMSCAEVINFVEKFRKICGTSSTASFPVKASNSIIAHLLAEEARFRWFAICEEEDVMIDDISIVVIELVFLEPFKELRTDPRPILDTMSSLVSIGESGRSISARRDDFVRSSFVPAREVARRRIDPKRGSYVYENVKCEDFQDTELIIKDENFK